MKQRILTLVALTLLAATPVVLAADGPAPSSDHPVEQAVDRVAAPEVTRDASCDSSPALPALDPLAGAQFLSCAPGVPSCMRDYHCDAYCLKQGPGLTGWCNNYCCGCSTQ
jgi:hypothetical protein